MKGMANIYSLLLLASSFADALPTRGKITPKYSRGISRVILPTVHSSYTFQQLKGLNPYGLIHI